MLTGRESLVRLIGKRRRFLPNRHSLLSIPLTSQEEEETNKETLLEKNPAQISSNEWVLCPVCSLRVPDNDSIINSHLDACLSSGKKRKLTQRTLLQFCSQSRTSSSSNGVLDDSIVDSNKLANISVENNDSTCEKLPLAVRKPIAVEIGNGIARSTQKYVDEVSRINCHVCPPSLPLKDGVAEDGVVTTLDDIVGVPIETFIVGRRFSTEREINVGDRICLLRDPDNAKDANAIKVLLADSSLSKVLGFLPRELAQYLSPLLDKHSVVFKGNVTSVPKRPLDVVPVQVMCCKVISRGDGGCSEVEAFTCLWKNVLHAVESAKDYGSSNTKYQQNFCLLMKEVLKVNPHLFTDAEKNFMEYFVSLLDDSQRLFVRLYTRKGPWFRMSNISYPEISDTKLAVKELSELGYVNSIGDSNELLNSGMEEILNLLSVSELRDISCLLKKNGCCYTRKQDLIAFLLSAFEDGTCLFLPTTIFDRTGMCVRISAKADSLIWRAERLFFLNGEQDLTAFLLVDLGVVKYPTYQCIMHERVFSTLDDLQAYEEAIELAQIMDESLEENNNELALRCIKIADSRISSPPAEATQSMASDPSSRFFSHFSAPWVYSKIILLGISFYERERWYKDAISLLKRLLACFPCNRRRGYWTLRLSIDLEHVGCLNESLSVAEDGLLDPWVRAGSRIALQRRVLRLGKPPRRWKTPSYAHSIRRKIKEVHIQGRPLNCEIGKKNRFYGEDGEQCGVEQLALQYYAGEGGGWNGVHSESGIWLTIFGLLMWNIMFSYVPNVFLNSFQTAPLDLETDGFYMSRKSLIESHLQKIHDGMAEEIVIKSWELHSGTSCRGVNWDRHSLSEIRAAVTCIGGPCLASLCRHLAQDYRSWSSGLPDLLLWRFNGEFHGEAKLVEVKGPKDRLSEQQHAWLLLLMDCGFNTEVCKVKPVSLDT